MRLRVVQRRVTCPFGRNDGLGGRDLASCYLDSLTPGHACVDPRKDGAERCPQVAVFAETLGLRTHAVVMEETSVNALGQAHQDHRVNVVYLPLDQSSERWYAMNAFTGERYEVVLHAAYPHRRTPEGEDVEQVYRVVDSDELDRRVRKGGMVAIPHTDPIWRGAPSRDEHRCRCASCTGQLRDNRSNTSMSDNEDEWEKARALLPDNNRRTSTATKSAPFQSAMGAMFSTPQPKKLAPVTKPVARPGKRYVPPADTSDWVPSTPRKTNAERREAHGPGSIVSAGFKELTTNTDNAEPRRMPGRKK